MPSSNYDDDVVNELRKRLWKSRFRLCEGDARGCRRTPWVGIAMALRQMIEETHHHWIEDNKRRNDILGKADWKSHEVDRAKIELPFIVNHCAKRILAQALSEIQVGRT
jgi:hypothetical protein